MSEPRYDTEYVWTLINDLADTRDDGTGPSKWAVPRARAFLAWLSANGVDRVVEWPEQAPAPEAVPSGPVQGPLSAQRKATAAAPRKARQTDAAPGASAMATALAAVRAGKKDLGDAFAEILDATDGMGGPVDTRVIYERSRSMYEFDFLFARTCAAMFGVKLDFHDDGSGSRIEATGPADSLDCTTLLMKLLRQTGWGGMKDRSPDAWKKTELKDGEEFAGECLAEAVSAIKRRKNAKA